MATAFKMKYSASVTPIETIEATDTSQKISLVHSQIDKSIGGGIEIACGATAGNVGYKEAVTTDTTTDSIDSITVLTLTGIDFLMVKIKANGDASTVTPDCTIEIGGQVASKLIGVGDVCLLRPSGAAGTAIEIYSSGATALAKIDIMYGIAS
jgi:hypothetical protein